jgi:hypothetical protein
MKRLMIFATALLLVGAAVAGDKVLQSSAKRMPKWVGGMEEGYFIVSAQAESLDAAQQKAMTQIREQIVSAIATTVHSATSITLHEVSDNGTIRSHREMDTHLSVKPADIPYLANVSPSHAKDFYWAHIRKSDKSTYYIYHVRYPFSNSKLRLLADEYEKQQKLLNDSLQAFASTDFADYDDLDRMLLRHTQLKQFIAGLREDDPRQDICTAIRKNYERMITQNIQIEIESSDRENTRVALVYGTRPLAYSILPKVKSNCLTAIEVQNLGKASLISYDFETGCYEEDQNWLDITFTVLSKKINTRCYIK